MPTLQDIARHIFPGQGRMVASFDAAIARAERVSLTGVEAIRYGVDQAVKIARRPPTSVLSQIMPVNVSEWDLTTIKSALEHHELGFFMQSVSLADAMGRDDRITGCLNTRVRALASKSGVGFSLTPSALGAAGEASDLTKEITDLWWYACPEAAIARILQDAVMLGVAFARIHWDRIDGQMVPRLEPWFAQNVYYDWSIRRYRAIGIEGQVIIDPGSAEWFVFEPAANRSWMAGAIRGLGIPYMYRQFSQNDWSRYCERHGIPIIKITEPAGHQWVAQKNQFYNNVKGIGRQGIIRAPQDANGKGFDLSYVEPKDKSWQAFKEFLMRMDVNIAVMLLGQNLSTEVQGGSYAASQVHNLIRLDYLDADAEMLSTALREQIWKPYVRFNHGPAHEPLTPWPTWATRPPEDMAVRSKVLYTFSQSVALLATASVPVDLPLLAEQYEVPLIKGAPWPIQMPPGGAPPAQPSTAPAAIPAPAEDDEEAPPSTQVGKPTASTPVAAPIKGDKSRKEDDKSSSGGRPTAFGRKRTGTAKPLPKGGKHGNQYTSVFLTSTEVQKNRARHAVGNLVKNGGLKDPNDVKCAGCGHLGSDKLHEYDHHKGYSDENATTVESVCTTCHHKRSAERASVWLSFPEAPLPTRMFYGGKLRVRVDRPKGFEQEGVARDGTPWTRTFLVDYGYLDGTLGGDGDELDVYCGDNAEATSAFWILQLDHDGLPDEWKLFLGFDAADDATACWRAYVPPELFGGVFEMPVSAVAALRGEDPFIRLCMLNGIRERAASSDIVMLNTNGRRAAAMGPRTHRDAAAAAAYSEWRSTVNVSATVLRSWSSKRENSGAAILAASTIRLLSTATEQWSVGDINTAKKAAKRISRMLRTPAGPIRDRELKALGCDRACLGAQDEAPAARDAALATATAASTYIDRLAYHA